jgi:hypothetical protein
VGEVFYLTFRDPAGAAQGVTAAGVYRLTGVDAGLTDWAPVKLAGGDWVAWDRVADLFRGKRVCFLVHGFNVSADHGVKGGGPAAQEYQALGAMGLSMSGADMVVPVLWPGDGFIGWSYFTAFRTTRAVGARFADFLTSRAFPAADVSFVSHSLGARVVLETVTQTALRRRAGLPWRFGTAALTAAAVDEGVLDQAPFAAGVAALPRIVVLSSGRDEILSRGFVVGDRIEGLLWADYRASGGGDGRALGRFGPQFATPSAARDRTEWYDFADAENQEHDDYLPAAWGKAAPGFVNGWTAKRRRAAEFCRGVFGGFAPGLSPHIRDRTAERRSGWIPRF